MSESSQNPPQPSDCLVTTAHLFYLFAMTQLTSSDRLSTRTHSVDIELATAIEIPGR